jgi:putative DNA primase/helicase
MSDAYNRRIIIIAFPNRFDGDKEDKQLISKLITEEEISGLFNVLMIALRRILRNNEIYVNEKTIEEKRNKYERTANPIKSFLSEAVAEDSTEADSVIKEEFYRAYSRFCQKYSLPVEKIEMFGKILKGKLGFHDGRQSTGDRKTYWRGRRLTAEYILEIQQKTII